MQPNAIVEGPTHADLELQLQEDVCEFVHDPLGHALYVYPWSEGALRDADGPRDWQAEELDALGEHLRNPETRFEPYQVAIATGHGVGKSSLIGMISKWALDTCANTRIVCTANTDNQLRTKTVPEVLKWHRAALTSHWFRDTATMIYSNSGEFEKSWRCDFTPWSVNNTEAFAGLHNQGNRIVIILDEASAVDDKIWEVIEGAMTDENTEIIWIAFGNPTRNAGRFRECFRKYSKYWRTRHLDSRTVEGTNVKYLNRIIEQYGEDSDQARIRVKGQFPDASAYQLFLTSDVDRANGAHLRSDQYDFAPKIISVDPAWTGGDEFVIGMRQGLKYEVLERHVKNDNDVQMANRIARLEDEHRADAVFVDGGYGTGIVSAGTTMGRSWRLVWFAEKSLRKDCVNKRAEMYINVRDWLKQGGTFAENQNLYDEMVATETVPTLDGKYKLPPKEELREQLGRSPNDLDALAISHAFPVFKQLPNDASGLPMGGPPRGNMGDYDPLDRI